MFQAGARGIIARAATRRMRKHREEALTKLSEATGDDDIEVRNVYGISVYPYIYEEYIYYV